MTNSQLYILQPIGHEQHGDAYWKMLPFYTTVMVVTSTKAAVTIKSPPTTFKLMS